MRITCTPQNKEKYPLTYWTEVNDTVVHIGTNDNEGYTWVMTKENIDWFNSYLCIKSAILVPKMVITIAAYYGDWNSMKTELLRL